MKNLSLISILLLSAFSTFAQAPTIGWQKSFGGTSTDGANYLIRTFDSAYVAVGNANSTNGDVTYSWGSGDVWLVKYDRAGAILWQKSYGGSAFDNGIYIQQTADSGFIMVANTRSNDGQVTGFHGTIDYWVVKLDDTGGITWQRTLGGPGYDVVHCVRQTADGGYIVAGRADANGGDVTGNHGAEDFWVVKLTAAGALTWEKSYGGSSDDDAGSVWQTPDGGYLILGNTSSHDGDVTGHHGTFYDDYWLIRINDTGALLWQKCYGGTGIDNVVDDIGSACLWRTADSNIIISGATTSTDGDVTGNHGGYDIWTLRLDDTGRILWQKCYGGTGDEFPNAIQQTADSGFVIAGTTSSTDGDVTGDHANGDYWVIKIASSATLQWEKCMGGTGFAPSDYATGVTEAFGGGFMVAGFSNSNDGDVTGNHGDFDLWVVKLNCSLPSAGTITGPSAVCAGNAIVLIDAATGGGWYESTGNTSVSSAGVVTGISAGPDIISYNVTNSCGGSMAIHVVSVDPLPAPSIISAGSSLSVSGTYSSYQWLLAGSSIAGATNATYTITAAGTYTVRVIDANGCVGTSASWTGSPVDVTSIQRQAIDITPNPSNGVINISGSGSRIKVYNSTGKLIADNNFTNVLDISRCPPGLYVVQIFDTEKVLLRQQRIIIER